MLDFAMAVRMKYWRLAARSVSWNKNGAIVSAVEVFVAADQYLHDFAAAYVVRGAICMPSRLRKRFDAVTNQLLRQAISVGIGRQIRGPNWERLKARGVPRRAGLMCP
jgi:hypothetical protein